MNDYPRIPKPRASLLLWIAALVFTVLIAGHQRGTGPTYPIEGKAAIGGSEFKYELKRSHGGESAHPVEIAIPDTAVTGWVAWKHHKLDEPLRLLPMERNDGKLTASLPHQPPAGKLEYQVTLRRGSEELKLPPGEPVVIRFKGHVPLWILIPHILCMFSGLLVAARAALEALWGHKTRTFAWVALGLVTVGGLMLGPIVQKLAFGAFWTGWPFGGDLTDNKTLVMALVWVVALWRLKGADGERRGRWWVVAAMAAMFAVYLIPHSMRGSELNWNAVPPDSVSVQTKGEN